MELIETVTLSSNASSIDFANIPQDGIDLYMIGSLRSAGGDFSMDMRYNGNSSSGNYLHLQAGPNGALGISSNYQVLDKAKILASIQSGWTSNAYSNFEHNIANYTVAKRTNSVGVSAGENNATASAQFLTANAYTPSQAITSISIFVGVGLAAQSTISLYKITG